MRHIQIIIITYCTSDDICFCILVCDLNEFEYPTLPSSYSNVKYLYRFRLDDGTADQNRSFQQFAAIYETYTRYLFY